MPLNEEIHVGDIGTVLQATVYDGSTTVDLSVSTERLFLLKNSAGTVQTLTAALAGSGTSGVLKFTSTAATFDTSGTYQLQAKITFGSNVFSSDVLSFRVYPNI